MHREDCPLDWMCYSSETVFKRVCDEEQDGLAHRCHPSAKTAQMAVAC